MKVDLTMQNDSNKLSTNMIGVNDIYPQKVGLKKKLKNKNKIYIIYHDN